MRYFQITKTIQLPESEEEFKTEPELNKHERWLRNLIMNNYIPIYIGDTVKVSERYAGDSKNPHEGKVGVVSGLEAGLQSAFNIDYLVYSVRTEQGDFQTYHYTLDRVSQPKGNELLEKLLRETNVHFESRYK